MANFIGVDNGISGSVGVITPSQIQYFRMPTFQVLNYQKLKAKNITRISTENLYSLLYTILSNEKGYTMALIERPMVNPKMFDATLSAVRALEAILVVLERLGIGYRYCDSKEWQRQLIPGFQMKIPNPELKKRSLDVAQRMYPHLDFSDFKDGDGILIATYLKNTWDVVEEKTAETI